VSAIYEQKHTHSFVVKPKKKETTFKAKVWMGG